MDGPLSIAKPRKRPFQSKDFQASAKLNTGYIKKKNNRTHQTAPRGTTGYKGIPQEKAHLITIQKGKQE